MHEIIPDIKGLKEEANAIILAHNYQRPDVQDIADYVGDSLGLAMAAAKTNADVIVFCGVDFMAETAKILNPKRTVLVPDRNALCPLAKMLSQEDIKRARAENPSARVVLYVNTHAQEKALADIVCTSANAPQIVAAMDSDAVIFGPDINMVHYLRNTGKRIISVPARGYCPTHERITLADVVKAKKEHPDAKLVVHPETLPVVQDAADKVASTDGMIRYCRESGAREFIIGTETGIIHRLKKECPGKSFYPASGKALCPNMKLTTLEKVRDCLKDRKYEITVPDDVAKKARAAIEEMLKFTGK